MVQHRTIGGEADFVCMRNGRQCAGVAATTQMVASGGQGSMWYASVLSGFLAPAERSGEAEAIMHHMVKTFQMNPEWVARQSQGSMESAQIAREASLHTSRIISETYWNRQHAVERGNEKFDQYIRGEVRLRDPQTGEQFIGPNGYNHYYRDGPRSKAKNVDIGELEVIR